MKKRLFSLLLAAGVFAFYACKKDDPTLFAEKDGIYFAAGGDSLQYTFAKYPSRLSDTLKIAVTVLGNPTGADRTITVEKLVSPDFNAVEGVHYKLLPPYTMPAGKVSTNIPVIIYRTPDLDNIVATFMLQVKENETFQSGISAKTAIKVKVGYLQKPSTWGDLTGIQWAGYSANFGTWTKTKYKVILQALYDPGSDTTVTEFPYSRFTPPASYIQYLQLVKNYIRTKYPGNYSIPAGIGATLRDPDNYDSLVKVGPSNY
ncbi:MAG TPA: DUF4843 domain-containing protein [Flavisolibacter sp.]|nr:DUF4843 domain-containing protein [Flavisolibacter sp.]